MASADHKVLGREEEIRELNRLWTRVSSGNPQWITLVGETGTGKTRLVQEFFRELSATQVAEKYWPRTLPSSDRLLDLNPHSSDFDSHELRPDIHIPWLWWGLRSTEPGKSGVSSRSAAYVALESLAIHIDPLVCMRAKQETRVDAAIEIGKNIAGVLTGGFFDPLLGIASLVKKGGDVLKRAHAGASSPGSVAADRTQTMNTLVIDSLLRYLDMQIPVILVLDDCHWLDAETVAMVESLCHKLGSQKMKLFIIATTWKREYETPGSNRIFRLVGNTADGRPSVGSFLGERHMISLSGLEKEDAFSVTRQRLPGASPEDLELIYSRTGGNLRHLHEICDFILRKTRHFNGGDTSSFLSELARRALLSKETDMDDLVDRRFSELPPDVQRALEECSYQGSQFDVDLAAAVADQLHHSKNRDSVRSTLDLINEAERPGSMISSVENCAKEFLPGPYWRVTRRSLEESREKEVSDEYRNLLPRMLEIPFGSLRPTHLTFIASQLDSCVDTSIELRCRAILVRSYCASQRYEAAYEQLAKVTTLELSYLAKSSPEFAEDVLVIINHFGVRPPVDIGFEPGLCARLAASVIWANVEQVKSSLEEVPTQLRRLGLVAASNDTLGEMLDAVNSHTALASYISEVSAVSGNNFEASTIAFMVNSLATAIERVAPYELAFPWITEAISNWLDVARRLCNEPRLPPVGHDLLSGRIGAIELQVLPALLRRVPTSSESFSIYAASANRVGEVLAVSYSRSIQVSDKEFLGLADSGLILAISASRVIEQALIVNTGLATVFLDRMRPLIESIAGDAMAGKYFSAQLATALVDVVLAAAILAKRETESVAFNSKRESDSRVQQSMPGFKVLVMQDRQLNSKDVSDWSNLALSFSENYFQRCKGSVEFVVARARVFVFVLDSFSEERGDRGKRYFDLVFEDAIAIEDAKRQKMGEPVQLEDWLYKICNIALVGREADEARAAIGKMYGETRA